MDKNIIHLKTTVTDLEEGEASIFKFKRSFFCIQLLLASSKHMMRWGRGREGGEECSISPLSRQWYSLLHMVLLTTLSGTRPFAACNKKMEFNDCPLDKNTCKAQRNIIDQQIIPQHKIWINQTSNQILTWRNLTWTRGNTKWNFFLKK